MSKHEVDTPPAVMPDHYWLVTDEDGAWLASFLHWGEAMAYYTLRAPRGRFRQVRVPACEHCDDGTCPACKGW